ncbi:MAG: hypothetical protein CVU41_13240 [Chloroflexi bacterium HGW-Chloroflexi-3]|nr:MAG: hypothetical protein CVU41_13240 [Chloroflexi bacterium HGW-Chloroflexi-3]
MDPIITRCGYRCDLCLAYKPNVLKNPENQKILSDGWYKYFGFRIPPEEIICDGCMAENPKLIDTSCPVRPCVIARRYHNCSECPDMICEKLKERLVVYEEMLEKMGGNIPMEDYQRFILPYENKRRLISS